MNDTPLVMVEDSDALATVCEGLSQAPVIGVDTESDSMYHYQEKVCLIQVSDRERDYIIDPLKIDDMSALVAVLADPKSVKVFHGADYDLLCLQRDYGVRCANIFDTLIAAQFLDLPRLGLADLCRQYFDVEMEKKYQRYDWSLRPLLPEHLQYARGDSHFLLALRELLLYRIGKAGVGDCVTEELQLLEGREPAIRTKDGSGWTRVKQSRILDDRGKHVLRQVWRLRDSEAQRLDRPPFKVMPDAVLLQLSQQRPVDVDGLRKILRPRSSLLRRYGDALVEAVQRGLEDDTPLEAPQRKPRDRIPMRYGSRDTERFLSDLKAWRLNLMKSEGLPLVLIGNNTQLKTVAGNRPKTMEELSALPGIREWQVARHGKVLLELVARFEAKMEADESSDSAPAGEKSSRRRRSRRSGSARRRARSKRDGTGDQEPSGTATTEK